jgi:hypothetical protein
VGGQCPMVDAGGEALGASHPGPIFHDDIVTEMMFRSSLTHPALMFRREVILKAGNYSRPKPVEDFDLYFRMAKICEFNNLEQEILHYRVHPKSICQTSQEEQQKLMVNVVAKYSDAIYGISSEDFFRLRAKKSLCSIFLLMRSAAYRSRGNPLRLRRIMFSTSFIDIGRCLTGPRDYISKITFRILERLLGRV